MKHRWLSGDALKSPEVACAAFSFELVAYAVG